MNSFKVACLLSLTSITKGNRGVLILTILILTLVGLNLLFVPSLLNGLISGSNDKLINTYSGDIVITSGDNDVPLLNNSNNRLSDIARIPGVSAVTARNSTQSQMSFEGNRTSATLFGILPDSESKVFQIDQSLIEGSYLATRDRDQILLGIQVAGADKPDLEFYTRSLQKVHAGDKIKLIYGSSYEKEYTVKGIFYTEFIQTDIQAMITQTEFESIIPNSRNHAASIHVKTTDNINLEPIISQINRLGNDYKILTWQDYAGVMRSMTDSFNAIKTILNIVNILVAGFTVFILTYIDVTSRRRQIGIQRAIGITSSSVMMAYLMRATFLALVGTALATLIFVKAITPLEALYPFHFPFGAVYLYAGSPDLTRMTFILLGVSLVAAFIPVRGVTRMRIMDAIWG